MPTYDIKPLFKPSIDKFLSSLSDEAKIKLWNVVDALRLEFELTSSTKFRIPHEKLEKNKSSEEDARASLISLHKKEIIKVSCKLPIRHTPMEYTILTIAEQPDIFSIPNTEIELDKDKFAYLEAKLKYIVHPEIKKEDLLKIENFIAPKKTSVASIPVKENEYSKPIIKKGDNFYFKEMLIDFGDGSQYKDLFDIIYGNCLQNNFISYEKINEELIKRGWKQVVNKNIKKRIQNSITNGIFRFAKIGNNRFENKLLGGRKILKVIRGRGIEFNNS